MSKLDDMLNGKLWDPEQDYTDNILNQLGNISVEEEVSLRELVKSAIAQGILSSKVVQRRYHYMYADS